MSDEYDDSLSVDELLTDIEQQVSNAVVTRQKIEELTMVEPARTPAVSGSIVYPSCIDSREVEDEEEDDAFKNYWKKYFSFSGSTLDEMKAILPDSDDYHFEDIILRLKAESLKEIKDIMICGFEDSSFAKASKQLIERELQKMNMLDQLLAMEEDVVSDEPEYNQIILVPNQNGNIMFNDDLSRIPVDFYNEVYSLLGTIIDGTFKRAKEFGRGSNHTAIGGSREVRGKTVRILYRKVTKNVYAIYGVFLKKGMNDKGYRNNLNYRNLGYLAVQNQIRDNVDNPEFMEQNDFQLQELWRMLGQSEAPKVRRKVDES